MRIKKMITKGELRPVLKQFLPTSTVRNALGHIRRICMLILGNKGLRYTHTCTHIHTVKIQPSSQQRLLAFIGEIVWELNINPFPPCGSPLTSEIAWRL